MAASPPSRPSHPGPDLAEFLPDHGARVRVRRLDLPLEEPFSISFETFTETPSLLAEATDGERTGVGEGAPISAITGESRDDALAAVDDWTPHPNLVDDLSSPAARTALEGALLDLAARREGVPLAELLGADGVGPVPTSVTLPLGGDDVAGRIQGILDQGVEILKVKAGDDVEADIERLRQVREAAGPDPALRVDPNQGWTRPQALEALDALEDLDVELLEQPLPEEDLAGHAMLREQTTVPVMLDESVATVGDVERIAEAEAADMVNIKLMKTGGPRAGLALADAAEAAGMTCMVGCMIESRVGIAQAAHLFHAHDAIEVADLDGAIFLAGDPVDGGPRLGDGAVQVPERPGSAIREVDAGETLDEIGPCRR